MGSCIPSISPFKYVIFFSTVWMVNDVEYVERLKKNKQNFKDDIFNIPYARHYKPRLVHIFFSPFS